MIKNRRETNLIGEEDGLVKGDSFIFRVTCYLEDSEALLDLTDYDDISFELSREEDGTNVVEKSLGQGIEVEGASNERAVITLTSQDTLGLAPRVYRWELTLISSLETSTPAYGSLEVLYSSYES